MFYFKCYRFIIIAFWLSLGLTSNGSSLLSHKSWWIIWMWRNNCHNTCLLCPLDLSGWLTRLDVNVVYYFFLIWTLPLTYEIFKLLIWICMSYFTMVLRNQNKNQLVFLCFSVSVYAAYAGQTRKSGILYI